MGGCAGDSGHQFVDEGNHSAQAEATLDMQRPYSGLCVCVCTVLDQERRGSIPNTCCCNFKFQAGGTWGMKRSGANEDTSSLPVISVLDAELTYLQRPTLCGRLERPPLCGRLDGQRCHNRFQVLHAACNQCLCCGHVACNLCLSCGHVTCNLCSNCGHVTDNLQRSKEIQQWWCCGVKLMCCR